MPCAVGEGFVVEEGVVPYRNDLEEDPCGRVCERSGGGPECESEATDFPSGDHECIVGTIVTVGNVRSSFFWVTVRSPLLLGDSADCLRVLLRFYIMDDLAETLTG